MWPSFIKRRLSRRFTMTFIAVVTLILVVFSGIGIFLRVTEINTRLKNRLDNTINIAVPSLESALWNFEKDTIKGICKAVFEDKEVVYLRLSAGENVFYEERKSLPAELAQKGFSFFQVSRYYIAISEDIYSKGEKVGTIEVAISKESSRRALIGSIISIALLTVIIGIALTRTTISSTRRFVFDPLNKLKDSATRIAGGDLDTEIGITGEDEIGVLAKDFEKMRGQVKKKIAELEVKRKELDELNKSLEAQVKERTAEYEKAKNEAEKANQSKDRFLADVSHEVRTPLNSIMGFIEQLQKSDIRAEQRKQLDIIDASSQDLLRLINDILDFSRMASGKGPEIVHADFRLKNVLHSVVSSFELLAKKKHITLSLNRRKGVPDYLVGDEYRLKQVLKNLVGNALRYTDEGEVIIKVACFNVKNKKATLFFAVKDTGKGIAKKDMNRIFNPYERINEDSPQGVGLGLTVTRQLVVLMGGRIKARSILGKGSEFYFAIPLEVQPKGEDSGSGIHDEKPLDFSDLKGLKVLLVEDDLSSQILMQGILENAGLYVDLAENGMDALQRVNSSSYDVVLMDMKLPLLSGYEATKKIRENQKFAGLPIIAVTAQAVVGDSRKCLDAGASDYIPKPVSADKILLSIQKWITKGEKR